MHDGTHIYSSITSLHVLDDDGDGFVFLNIKNQVWKKEVVPDPHCFKNTYRNISWFHNWKDNREESTDRITSVNHSCFLDFNRDRLTKPQNINTASPAPTPDKQ